MLQERRLKAKLAKRSDALHLVLKPDGQHLTSSCEEPFSASVFDDDNYAEARGLP